MMVGVPVLLVVCVGACVPFTWVMAVGVGVSGFWWCVFQWCVAVVPASRRVPGVGSCVCVVLACWWCACVVGLGVKVLWWFRMLTCSGLFPCLFGFACLFG